MPSGRSVGQTSYFDKKMLKRITVFKVMPSGRSVGPTSIFWKIVRKRATIFTILPSGRSVGQTSTSRKSSKACNCVRNHASGRSVGATLILENDAEKYKLSSKSCLLGAPWAKLLIRKGMQTHVTVGKIMPSGRSVGTTSISPNGNEIYNCF